MRWIRHHAIIVTATDCPELKAAHQKAVEIFGKDFVTSLIAGYVNSYESFLIPPDGSKEGWVDSEVGDARRSGFIKWLQSDEACFEDGSSMLSWVEVQYGDDGNETEIVNDSDAKMRAEP